MFTPQIVGYLWQVIGDTNWRNWHLQDPRRYRNCIAQLLLALEIKLPQSVDNVLAA